MQKVIGVVVLGILLVGGYFLLSNSSSDEQDLVTVSGTELERLEGINTLKELVENGEDLECEFIDESTPRVESTGTVYISDKKFRVTNDRVEANGEETTSHIIYDEQNVYAWTAGAQGTFGFTFAIPPDEVLSEDGQLSGENEDGSVSLDQEYDFRCKGWQYDAAVFVAPEDVDFFDPASAFGQ